MRNGHKVKSHNVSYLLYHFVCPIKNRKKILRDEKRIQDLRDICIEIEENYEIYFLEIGSDIDHVHFLIQSVPVLSVSSIITRIKSLSGR
jgi:REP element-mobilizing transposase RayT